MNEFDTQVPDTPVFQVGYFFGKQSSKYWLVSRDDLNSMYRSIKKGSVLLWCDKRSCQLQSSESRKGQKRKLQDDPPQQSKSHESEVDEIVSDLRERHGTTYTLPKLRLWARVITTGNWDDRDKHPPLPAFDDNEPKKVKKAALSDVIASSVVKAMTTSQVTSPETPTKSSKTSTQSNKPIGLSPGRVTDLRIKKLQELRELQQLLEQNVLTDAEFEEQKMLVLNALRKLTH